MKTYLDCYPCFLRQALNASRRAKASEDQQRRILLSTMEELAALPADTTPPHMALCIHQQVRQQTLVDDPYREDKEKATQQGLANYESLSGQAAPIFYLLQAKCSVIAKDLGVTPGDIIIKQELPDG